MSTVTVGEYLIVNSQLLSSVFSQLRIHLRVKTIYILLSDSCYHISFTMSVSKRRRAAAIAAYNIVIMQWSDNNYYENGFSFGAFYINNHGKDPPCFSARFWNSINVSRFYFCLDHHLPSSTAIYGLSFTMVCFVWFYLQMFACHQSFNILHLCGM